MPKHPKNANTDRPSHDAPPEDSFENFFKHYRLRYEKRLSRNMPKEDAKDLAQDVLINVWLALRCRRVRNLAAVVARAIKNAIVDRWRKQHVRKSHEAQLVHDYESLQAAPSGAESAALQDERVRLLQALSKEHPEAYQAYVLHRYDGLQFSKIAEQMGIGRNRASKLVRIALIKLHEAGVQEDSL